MWKASRIMTLSLVVVAGALAAATPSEVVAAPAAAVALCAPGILVVRVATDRGSYRRRQRVSIRVTVRNTGRIACSLSTGNCLPQVLVRSDAGVVVWNRATTQVVCNVVGARRLAVGAATAQVVAWDGKRCTGRDPKTCPGRSVEPGRYRVSAIWARPSSNPATFAIR